MMGLIVLAIVLAILIIILSIRHDKRQETLLRHAVNKDIVLQATPDFHSSDELRLYNIKYIKDGQQQSTTLKARNFLDAKYQAIVSLDIDRKSILSVV